MTMLPTGEIAGQLGAVALGWPQAGDAAVSKEPQMRDAVKAWRSLLGPDRVQFDDATRSDYARTTLPRSTTPSGVLRPRRSKEVQEVARVASRYGVRLHAISRSKNWGYGDACASTDGQVIVDLRDMNQVREVNVELGYAVIEPGVSQGQMHEHLQELGAPLLLDVTGAGPDASIVGNILQRGFGHTPYGDRFRHTSGLEVVLPDGRLINTGFGALGGTEISRVFPWGAGPWIDGLFTQSSHGIVTAACIWLMPRPAVIEGFALKLKSHSRLGDLVDALRQLRMAGVVRSTVHVANDLRVLSSREGRSSVDAVAEGPLSDAVRARARRAAGIGEWNLLGALYGSEREVRAQRAEVRRVLRSIAPVRFFRRKTVERAKRVARLTRGFDFGRRFGALVDSVDAAFDLLEGVPNAEHLRGARWRAENAGDLRECGLIWVAPVIPMTASHSERLLKTASATVEEHGFDLLVTLTAVTERAMCCVISINYDKRNHAEEERAWACGSALKSRTESLGYFGYRSASIAPGRPDAP